MLRIRTSIELARSIRLSFDVEAGVAGRGSHPSLTSNPDGEVTASPSAPEETPEPIPQHGNDATRVQAAGEPAREWSASVANKPRFFVVGHAKSGTSWLMNLLHSHPEILCRGEGKLFGKDSSITLHGILAHSEPFQTWLASNPWTRRDGNPGLEDIVGVVADYLMAEKGGKAKKQFVGDKTPFLSAEIVEEISTISPGSKVIHIVRDGRDVAVSTVHHQWNRAANRGGQFKLTPTQEAKRDAYRVNPDAFGTAGVSIFSEGEVEKMARTWRTFVGRAMRDGPRLMDGDYHQLRYEDLLTEPVAQVRGILEFLNADSSAEVAGACVEAASFEKKAGRQPGHEDPTSFYRKGVSGDWKSVFTEKDRQAFDDEAGELLTELGYERDEGWQDGR